MKAKITIENGRSKIELTPENEFEITMIETVCNDRTKQSISTTFEMDHTYGVDKNHRIILAIVKKVD